MRGAEGWTIRAGAILVLFVAGAARAGAQTPEVSIHDVRVIEGNGGSWNELVTVTLSGPSLSPVDMSWSTVPGSALANVDFDSDSGLVHFDPGITSQTLQVSILTDSTPEWSPTLQQDEAFFVALGTPTNATLLKGRATVTIVDDDRPLQGLQLVSAVADGTVSEGRVRLQWRVPAATASGTVSDVLVRWNEGAGCAAPVDAVESATGEFLLSNPPLPMSPATVKPAGETQVFAHRSRPFVEHCYALFAVYTLGGTTTERAVVSATPFDATAPNLVAWTYSAGGSSPNVVPPTVGPDAVYTVSTDGVVHAMSRGVTGGTWPTGWNPVGLGKAAHNRSPVVPFPYGPRLFVGTESGEVHAVNGLNGATAWSRSSRFAGSQLPNVGGSQGTPAGLFKAFSGLNDVLLVGANLTSGNTFFMLNPVTGADVSPYSHGSMGSVLGMPVVDYAGNRVHFVTTLPAGVLWTFDLGAAGAPSLTPSTLGGPNPLAMAYGSNSSPVLRNGRLYFGLTDGELIPYRLSDGAGASSPLALADGQVKGFVFPDRRNNWIYLSTGTKVWGVKDTVDPTAPSLVPWWFAAIPSPSPVLHWPNTNYLYVGGGNGCLYQLDVSLASPATTKKSVLLDPSWQIGAPSLDGPNGLALVGSLSGVVFAVRVPFATEECP